MATTAVETTDRWREALSRVAATLAVPAGLAGLALWTPGRLGPRVANLVDYAFSKMPGEMRLAEAMPTKVVSRRLPVLSETSYMRGDPSNVREVVLNPRLLDPRNRDVGALSLFHELSHPQVEALSSERLRQYVLDALRGLPRRQTRHVLSAYKGRDVLEELAVRLAEQRMAQTRFGLQEVPWLGS